MRICSVEECQKNARGFYCDMHRQRLRRTGELGSADYIVDPRRLIRDRIYSRLVLVGDSPEWDCWEWSGASRRGYGSVKFNGRMIYVHRWVYEDMIHVIPEGLLLDHLCLNRICANPYHLDPVTDAENKRRGGHWHGERHRAS